MEETEAKGLTREGRVTRVCVFDVSVVDKNADYYDGRHPHMFCPIMSGAKRANILRLTLSEDATSHRLCYL